MNSVERQVERQADTTNGVIYPTIRQQVYGFAASRPSRAMLAGYDYQRLDEDEYRGMEVSLVSLIRQRGYLDGWTGFLDPPPTPSENPFLDLKIRRRAGQAP